MLRLDHPEIIYQNVRLLQSTTVGLRRPASGLHFVAVKDGRILAIGPAESALSLKGPETRLVHCQGGTLLPGFVDAHCHFLALASQLGSIDCSYVSASSIPQLVSKIARESVITRSKEWDGRGWIRAFGYDEFYLRENRHPTRWDLDQVSQSHPIRLDHRTGHAMVLNSPGLELLHINKDTPDPVDGVVHRDEVSGEPTGVLLEMARWVRDRLGHTRDEQDVRQGARQASRLLLSKGVTSLHDATPSNGPDQWKLFMKLRESGCLVPWINMMMGADRVSLEEQREVGTHEDAGLRLGAVKIMVTLTTGALQPSEDELRELVLEKHRKGLQVAVHAVEAEAVEAAADALLYAQDVAPRPDARHRIEHCSECPPHVVDKIARAQAVVVTQPSFIYERGERYLHLVDDGHLPHLYPVASLAAAGIPIAAGSDAPVTHPDPLAGIYAAASRKTKSGATLGPGQDISVKSAIAMHTMGGAYAAFEEGSKGAIGEGYVADFVLLEQDPSAVELDAIKDIRALLTVVAGVVVWRS